MYDALKAEKDSGELMCLLDVINMRLSSMASMDFKLLTVDPELWRTVANQLSDAGAIAFGIFRNCDNRQP